MIDKTKVEKSEAKATELEKKVCMKKKKSEYIFLCLRIMIFLTHELPAMLWKHSAHNSSS